MNQQLKSQLGKLCRDSGIKWINALPLVLHNLRACPRGNLNLSPYEILFGRPSPVYNTQFPTSELEVGESDLTQYVIHLQRQLIRLHRYAASSQNIPLDENIHPYQPGDWILAKTYHKVPLQPTWEGPYQVLLTTPTSVKVAEKTAWLHHTRCKPALPPEPTPDDSPYHVPRQPADDDNCNEQSQQTGPDRGNPFTHPTLLSAWKRVMNLPDPWDPSPISQCFFRTFNTGRIDSCLQGLFWICGHRGYVWASPHSRGTCYLGLILPGVRVTQELPPGKRRNKRAKDLSELSDVAANGETYGRALFPAYGAGSNHVDILKLTDILLNFMEESNAATQSILTELTEVRQNSIQNRLALDYVLASTGGVCALIGTECCTHVTDQTLNITGHLNNIYKLTDKLRDIQHEGLSDTQLWSWLPGSTWIKQLLGNGLLILITVAICVAFFCCMIHCFPMCCQTCGSCLPALRPRSTTIYRPSTAETQSTPIELGPLHNLRTLDSRYDIPSLY
uniref:Murine leukemia virus integrase C-terminal domain-containing protein n=1 Tax=Podarcis muralis TaxID=64176 RepID=A0A670HVR3_PODMU